MVIEEFDEKFRTFFSQNTNSLTRWPQLLELFATDYEWRELLFLNGGTRPDRQMEGTYN